MYYLPASACDNTLKFTTGNPPAGGTLCFDYMAEAADILDRLGVMEPL